MKAKERVCVSEKAVSGRFGESCQGVGSVVASDRAMTLSALLLVREATKDSLGG